MTDAELVREIAQPLSGSRGNYDTLLQLIGDARIVLLGEATRGTHEFYFERAAITKRLIAEKGFSILAIEADWPDSARVHLTLTLFLILLLVARQPLRLGIGDEL
jgi:erythromycin esterase-like protein